MTRTVRRPGTRQPAPPPAPSQAELRKLRRRGLPPGHYTGDWSLSREITDQLAPLAARISYRPHPSRFVTANVDASVPAVADAVHELVGTIVGWCAERDARAKTTHLADNPGKRRYAMTTIVDLAPRPQPPAITPDMAADGSWLPMVAAMAADLDAPFSELLGDAYPPNAPELRGQRSRSQRLAALLGDTLDRAALALERRLDRDEKRPACDFDPAPTPDPDDDARNELSQLGIQL